MPKIEDERVVETATEARRVTRSLDSNAAGGGQLGIAALVLAIVWFVFFRS
jgi:hypothetical protein